MAGTPGPGAHPFVTEGHTWHPRLHRVRGSLEEFSFLFGRTLRREERKGAGRRAPADVWA